MTSANEWQGRAGRGWASEWRRTDRSWGGLTEALLARTREFSFGSVMDVGCGAGLLCEPLARLGAAVTGIDAAPENIAAARTHAVQSGLAIAYAAGELATLGEARFDLVTSLEVVEHVTDPAAFVAGLAGALADDGLLILSTPNRTAQSRLALITFAEGTGRIPRGTGLSSSPRSSRGVGADTDRAGEPPALGPVGIFARFSRFRPMSSGGWRSLIW